jgi:hypothetical protein
VLVSLVARATPDLGLVLPRRELERRAIVVLGELASADPLPSGEVSLVAHALVRVGRRWAPAGLANLRVEPSALFRRTRAASRELGSSWAQDLPVRLPWLLVEGVRVRPTT